MEETWGSGQDLDDEYDVTFVDLRSLGYQGSGEPIRGFNLDGVLKEIEEKAIGTAGYSMRSGDSWSAFDVSVKSIKNDASFRLDLKYWHPETVEVVKAKAKAGATSIADLNTIKTRRGSSPKAETYVGDTDGFAAVIKAGTSITRYGQIIPSDDYIEKDVFDDMQAVALQKGDVLIASTGTGTLGKVGVYDLDLPGVADGHVTIVRADPKKIYPYYLADYLRVGGGAVQIDRLYTGSTGLIELTPEDVDKILVDTLGDDLKKQKKVSQRLRDAEAGYQKAISGATGDLETARSDFLFPEGVV